MSDPVTLVLAGSDDDAKAMPRGQALIMRYGRVVRDEAKYRQRTEGAHDAPRVERKMQAHRQQVGGRYWKLRKYVEFLESCVPPEARERAERLSRMQGKDLAE